MAKKFIYETNLIGLCSICRQGGDVVRIDPPDSSGKDWEGLYQMAEHKAFGQDCAGIGTAPIDVRDK